MLVQKIALGCLCFCLFLPYTYSDKDSNLGSKLKKQEENKFAILPPCSACKNLVKSFEKGVEKTARGKHDGGDALWEESRLGSYARSEVRLVEIQEMLCKEVQRGEDQCHRLAGEHEHLLEEWWFQRQDEKPSLHEWLCIEKREVCCPEHHYGPNCEECAGGVPPCNNNGKCKGDGTRKGSGACVCDAGYKGALCNECANGYYEAYRDVGKLLCDPCHKSCQEMCTRPGPKGCLACKTGWIMETENGCVDENECLKNRGRGTCAINQFCVNNIGSFSCINCDKSCESCDGDGPDMCIKCGEGYIETKEKGRKLCVDKEEYEEIRKRELSSKTEL